MLLVTAGGFERWLDLARKGKTMIYYVGHLAADREKRGPNTRKLNILAREVYSAQRDGLVFLTQRISENGGYEYRATRSAKRV